MGLRGPKPGFKSAKKEGAATPLSSIQTTKPAKTNAPKADTPAVAALSAADSQNPMKLSGTALRELAYRRGIGRSLLEDMSDEKIRVQMNYVVHRQYEAEEVA